MDEKHWPRVVQAGLLRVEVHHPRCALEVLRARGGAEAVLPKTSDLERLCDCSRWEGLAEISPPRRAS